MSGGFMSLLKECDFQVGALDAGDMTEVTVYFRTDEDTRPSVSPREVYDAVGLIEQADQTLMCGFEWVDPDPAAIRRRMADDGLSTEQIDDVADEIPSEPTLLLMDVVPYRAVRLMDTGSDIKAMLTEDGGRDE